ncbi:hypothetical protein [Paracoccus homiensis]|uniref:hypothetical protein n=1 Tax=Paracoccus homiensis TaxID=364199 RepID=UPI00398CDEEF
MTNQAEDLGKPVDPSWESELLPSRRLDDVYRALIPQIGKLGDAEVASILNLHGQYGMYLDKLALLSTKESESPYLRVKPKYRAEVSVICLQVSAAAKKAVSTLSKAHC